MKPLKLILAVLISLSAGFFGSLFNSSISTWYTTLTKPAFNPPSWVFAPVWTLLYILMGLALWLVLEKKWEKVKLAVLVFAVQLVLNVLWSFFFFYLQSPILALIEIAVLWLAVAYTIRLFYRIDKRSAYLLIPYILWVSFALVLNLSIWWLN